MANITALQDQAPDQPTEAMAVSGQDNAGTISDLEIRPLAGPFSAELNALARRANDQFFAGQLGSKQREHRGKVSPIARQGGNSSDPPHSLLIIPPPAALPKPLLVKAQLAHDRFNRGFEFVGAQAYSPGAAQGYAASSELPRVYFPRWPLHFHAVLTALFFVLAWAVVFFYLMKQPRGNSAAYLVALIFTSMTGFLLSWVTLSRRVLGAGDSSEQEPSLLARILKLFVES